MTSDPSVTRMVREGFERACRAFTDGMTPLGFTRTKKTLWVRRQRFTAEVVHLHRRGVSYGGPLTASIDIRIHLGVRVLADDQSPLAIAGPFSDELRFREGRYHLRFNARTGDSFERCVADLDRFVVQEAEPWFRRFRSTSALLTDPESPLRDNERRALSAAVEGSVSSTSLKELGLERT